MPDPHTPRRRRTRPFAALALATLATLAAVASAGCTGKAASDPTASDFARARAAFETDIHIPGGGGDGAVPTAPANVFKTLKYPAPVGPLSAYLSPDPGDGRRHPAIIWITGGDCNSIGDLWKTEPRSNDQTAAAFRKAGIVMMFPSLRGGNDNPGTHEFFYGEADDILAAADFLARQPDVDPARIYLGGHSTGGTLALLTAEMTARFRAVFAFGPISRAASYVDDPQTLDFTQLDPKEDLLRSPSNWLSSIHERTFVLEGEGQGRIVDLRVMQRLNANPLVSFVPVPGATHFSVLAPANDVIAAKILADTGPATNIAVSADEIVAAMR